MKNLLLCTLLLMMAFAAFSEDNKAKEYPLTLNVLSTDSRSSQYTSDQQMQTDCTSDDFGHTNCSTTGGTKQGSVLNLTQTAEGSDGNICVIQWASRRQNFGAGMASSSGASTRYGTTLLPGEYKARFDKHGLKLLIPNQKGELREHSFTILSVRKKDAKPK